MMAVLMLLNNVCWVIYAALNLNIQIEITNEIILALITLILILKANETLKAKQIKQRIK